MYLFHCLIQCRIPFWQQTYPHGLGQGRIQDFAMGEVLAGSLGTKVPQRGQGAKPQWEKARRMLRHEAKKPRTERKTSPYRPTLYDNIIIIIISSTHRFMFPVTFVLKYKTQSV